MFGRSAARADYVIEGIAVFWIAYLHALRWYERRHNF